MKICLNIFIVTALILLATSHQSSAIPTSTIENAALKYAGKIFGFLGNFWKPLGIISKIFDVFGAKNQKDANEEHWRKLDKQLEQIQKQLQELTKEIDTGFANVEKDLKMNLLLNLITEQVSMIDKFQVLVNTSSSFSDFPALLNEFIHDYQAKNFEIKMVNLIDAEAPGTGSMVTALIRAAKKEASSNSVSIRSSPDRLLYDFYMSLMYNVYRGYYFIEACVLTKDIIHKKLHEQQHQYFQGVAQMSINKLMLSMTRMTHSFGTDIAYRKSYLNYKSISSYHFCRFNKFYLGISMAPKGYVITGVRYRLHQNNILYIQIQVGQLIDHGQINATTIHWQEPHLDIDSAVYEFECEGEFYYSSDFWISFNGGVMTGIQLTITNFRSRKSLGFSIYGYSVKDHNRGILDNKLRTIKYNKLEDENLIGNLRAHYDLYFYANNVELDVKAPLSGISFHNHKISKNYICHVPQVITYDAKSFVFKSDIDQNIKTPMSQYTKNEIRKLIHAHHEKHEKVAIEIEGHDSQN